MQDKNLLVESIAQIETALTTSEPRLISASDNANAAVCLIFSDCEQPELSLLMIRRAKHFGDPWSGHMAFPGGRIEATDASKQAGALRELSEELGIHANELEYLGRLSDIQANPIPGHRRLVISPFVFKAKQVLAPVPNYEVAATYWIPLSFFKQEKRQKMWWLRKKSIGRLPYYRYQGRRVWGLSLAMIDELFEIVGSPLGASTWRKRYQKR